MKHYKLGTSLLATVLLFLAGCKGCQDTSASSQQGSEESHDSQGDAVESAESSNSQEQQTASNEEYESESGGEVNDDRVDSSQSASSDSTVDEKSEGSPVSEATGRARHNSDEHVPNAGANTPANPLSESSTPDRGVPPSLAPPKFESSEKALEFANRQRDTAAAQNKNGDTAKAYEQALRGWQALQSHLADKGCSKLSTELLADLENYGEDLGTQEHLIIGKALKIK